MIKIIIPLALLLLSLQSIQAQQYNGKYFNNLNDKGVIVDSYDAVAFFTDNKPVKGDPATRGLDSALTLIKLRS